jgi:methionyl-tRNA formyltransferase
MLADVAPDVLAVVSYGEILATDVLAAARIAAVNLHLSLLPRWRGASPVQRAIWAGDAVTGATTMVMDSGMDTGPILGSITVTIEPEEDAGALGERLARLGGTLLASNIRGLAAGKIEPHPQPEEGVSMAPKLTAADRVISWGEDAPAIARQVRALAPVPGAHTSWRGQLIKILRGAVVSGEGPAPAGSIVALDSPADEVLVETGSGRYRLSEVAPAGRSKMSAGDWARGARFAIGERLG